MPPWVLVSSYMFSCLIYNIVNYHMNKPVTLQEYLEMISLQRKREFFLANENQSIPNPLSLDS